MYIIVLIDASGRKVGDMDVPRRAKIDQIQCTDYVCSNGLSLVILAPVDVRPSGNTSTVENMRWLELVKLAVGDILSDKKEMISSSEAMEYGLARSDEQDGQ